MSFFCNVLSHEILVKHLENSERSERYKYFWKAPKVCVCGGVCVYVFDQIGMLTCIESVAAV